MTDMDHLRDGLVEARRQAKAAVMGTQEWADYARVSAALNAFDGHRDHAPTLDDLIEPVDVATPHPVERSVAEAVLEVLETQDRSWTGNEMITEFDARGWGFGVSDLGRSIRTAFWNLVQREKAVNVSRGHYRAAKFATSSDRVESGEAHVVD